ncbi:hypothetical protein C8J57DRAFT_1213351 [Mycena rebaudengoi]|nr:hypothetical protein C8J57DRAFT_1213351 [Mycena rebaudengoi]
MPTTSGNQDATSSCAVFPEGPVAVEDDASLSCETARMIYLEVVTPPLWCTSSRRHSWICGGAVVVQSWLGSAHPNDGMTTSWQAATPGLEREFELRCEIHAWGPSRMVRGESLEVGVLEEKVGNKSATTEAGRPIRSLDREVCTSRQHRTCVIGAADMAMPETKLRLGRHTNSWRNVSYLNQSIQSSQTICPDLSTGIPIWIHIHSIRFNSTFLLEISALHESRLSTEYAGSTRRSTCVSPNVNLDDVDLELDMPPVGHA